MSTTPADVAAMIGGIRAVQPCISAAAVEMLMCIAAGIDNAPELHRQMGISLAQADRLAQLLCGRGTAGKRPRRSNLRLVERSKHPNTTAFRLTLSANGRELIAATFPDLEL